MSYVCDWDSIDRKRMQKFGGKTDLKSPLTRPKRKWTIDIDIYVREIGLKDRRREELAQDRPMDRCGKSKGKAVPLLN
jgi:hypothetical protein